MTEPTASPAQQALSMLLDGQSREDVSTWLYAATIGEAARDD